jgi:DnaJ family protein B protein 11
MSLFPLLLIFSLFFNIYYYRSFFGGGGGQSEEEEEKTVKGHDVIVDLHATLEDLYMGSSLKVG